MFIKNPTSNKWKKNQAQAKKWYDFYQLIIDDFPEMSIDYCNSLQVSSSWKNPTTNHKNTS